MKALFIAALAAICVAFSGCATTTQSQAEILASLQAKVVSACAVVNPFIHTLGAMQESDDAAAKLASISTANAEFCAAASSATITKVSASNFVSGIFPSLISVVEGSGLTDSQKSSAEIAITAAELSITTVLANLD